MASSIPAARSPQVVLRDMSILFVECAELHKEFVELQFEATCCKKCHVAKKNLIYVRPFRDEAGNTDWDVCVEAMVCCAVYNFVRALPREWWLKKAREAGVARDDNRGYIYTTSTHLNTERASRRPSPQAKSKAVSYATRKKAVDDANERERSGGISGWLKR
jgi:hypothetical protein